jgi:hypothetical protein
MPAMFIRWQKRQGKTDVYWGAVLIEAVRVDGKPRQRYVAHLGGFTEQGIENVHQRCRFWDRVNERLHAVASAVNAPTPSFEGWVNSSTVDKLEIGTTGLGWLTAPTGPLRGRGNSSALTFGIAVKQAPPIRSPYSATSSVKPFPKPALLEPAETIGSEPRAPVMGTEPPRRHHVPKKRGSRKGPPKGITKQGVDKHLADRTPQSSSNVGREVRG